MFLTRGVPSQRGARAEWCQIGFAIVKRTPTDAQGPPCGELCLSGGTGDPVEFRTIKYETIYIIPNLGEIWFKG